MGALYLKDNPKGIDKVINDTNKIVFDALTELDWFDYNAYHRAYKNPTQEGTIAEVFDIDSKDYSEVFFDDRLDASSFFVIDDNIPTTDTGRIFDTTVSMIFQCDLSKIANAVEYRADEEIISQVVNALKGIKYGNISAIIRGIENVYSGFRTEQIKYTDMNPFFCFRIDLDVNYQYDCCDGCSYVLPAAYLLTEAFGYLVFEDGGRVEIE
jgi:hypothetical protein